MNKFQKRIRKLTRKSTNALVVGNAFGLLDEILGIFNTVFVISDEPPLVKSKNLVFRENFNNLTNITDVGAIFFDLSQLHQLENLQNFWSRNNSKVLIEGNEVIEREFSKPLYKTNWGCVSQNGFFHVWEQIK